MARRAAPDVSPRPGPRPSPQSQFNGTSARLQRRPRSKGRRAARRRVIRGNHHDAWVTANTIHKRHGRAWKKRAPSASLGRRDGSEHTIYTPVRRRGDGLIGSTEGSRRVEELRRHAVLYSTRLERERLPRWAARTRSKNHERGGARCRRPAEAISCRERDRAQRILYGAAATARGARPRGLRTRTGSGSDFTPSFKPRVAYLNIGFGGEAVAAVPLR